MDLAALLSNKVLLVQLSKEYELLKKSGAEVDYEAWVRQRIREAARGMTTKQEPAHQSQPPVAIDTTTSNQAPSVFSLPVQSDQLFPSSRPYWHMGTTVTGHRVVPVQVENVAGGMMLAGEGLSQAEFISTAKPHGVEIQATHEEGSRGARGNAAAVSAAQARAHSRAEEPVFISRLYAERDARDVWSQQPEASVQPHYKGPRDQHGRPVRPSGRPAWVSAASLHSALRGSSAVPHLQASAERERRLALAAAVAKEQVALGVTGDSAAAASREVARAEVEQVLHVAQHIAQQHEGLAKAVRDTHDQLKQHQELLAAALQGRMLPSSTSAAPTEAVPDAWFIRAAQQGSKQPQAGGGAAQDAAAAKAQQRREKKERLKAALRQMLKGGVGADVPRKAPPPRQPQPRPPKYAPGAVPDMQRLVQALLAQRQRQEKANVQGLGGRGAAGQSPGSSPNTQENEGKARRKAWARPDWDSSPPPAHPRHPGRPNPLPPAHRAPPTHHNFGSGGGDGGSRWDVEDAAARALHQDTAAAHDMARIQKLEMLEGRMVELASRLETQSERTFHLHSQQQLQQQQRAATNAAQPPPQQRPASQQPSDSEHTAPRGQQGAGDGGGGRAAPGVSTAELHLLMAQLQRMEEQEAAIRRKWLAPSKGQEAGSEPPASKPQGMEVSDGLVRSMSAPRPQSSQNSVSSASSSSSDGVAGTGAAAAVKITMQLERDMVPDSMLESVLETRRLFLRHQEFRDGEVMTSSDPELSPVDIVEDIADVLLEELLQQQAEDLLGVCDALGEHMFDSEFEAIA